MTKTANEEDDPIVPEIVVEHADTTALEAVVRAEYDTQIATAKRYPRSISVFLKEAEELATVDTKTAESMFYSLPRGRNEDGTRKMIEGPSVRLAEVITASYGNLHKASRLVAIEDKFVRVQAVCWDIQKNIREVVEVSRRITDSKGRRYNEDMIGVTIAAAAKIASRNAVFGVVPRAFVDKIYAKAREVSLGKGLTMEQRRANAFAWFAAEGAKEADVLGLLERKALVDVTVDDLLTLHGLRTALKEKMTTITEAFSTTPAATKTVTPSTLTPEAIKAGAVTQQDDAGAPAATPPAEQAPGEVTDQEVAAAAALFTPSEG